MTTLWIQDAPDVGGAHLVVDADPLRCDRCGRYACAHTDPTPPCPPGSHYLEDAEAVARAVRKMVAEDLEHGWLARAGAGR